MDGLFGGVIFHHCYGTMTCNNECIVVVLEVLPLMFGIKRYTEGGSTMYKQPILEFLQCFQVHSGQMSLFANPMMNETM